MNAVQLFLRIGLALGLVVATSASAQAADAAEIGAYFTNLADHPNELRAVMEQVDGAIPDGVWAVLQPHVAPILRDPAYAAYVAGRLSDLVGPGVDEAALLADFATLGDAWAYGLQRLPPTDQETFLSTLIDSLAWARDNAPEICQLTATPIKAPGNGLLTATLSVEEASSMRQANARERLFYEQNLDTAERYYALLGEATLAEINGAPARRTVAKGAITAETMSTYGMAIYYRVAFLPNADAVLAAIAAVNNDPDGSVAGLAPEVICDLTIANYEAIIDMPPAERSNLMLALVIGIADPLAADAVWSGARRQ